MRRLAAPILVFLPLTGPLLGQVLQVPAVYPEIQSALDASNPGDTVLVAPGTYTGSLTWPAHDVTLQGGGADVTTIVATNFAPCITMAAGRTRASVIAGFTLTGANASDGGGVSIVRSSPTIRDNVIRNNRVQASGGGIYVNAGSPLIERNRIADNTQTIRQVRGGGIAILGAGSAEILDNVIENNDAFVGGAIQMNSAGTPTIRGNVLRNNTASSGGAIECVNGSDARIVQNLIHGNSAPRGGAISHSNGNIVVVGNTIADNTAGLGSAVWALRPIATLTFVDNIMSVGTGAGDLLFGDGWRPEIAHVFANNVLSGATVYGGDWPDFGTANSTILADPQLRPDHRIGFSSPARDAGGARAELPAVDFFGNARTIGAAVDIGASEFSGLLPLGEGCQGLAGAVPTIRGDGLPQLGNRSFRLRLEGADAASFAMCVLGLDATTWNGAPLPFDLGAFGLPGCALRVAPMGAPLEVVTPQATASTGCPIQSSSALLGAEFYAQWITLAAASIPGSPPALAPQATSGALVMTVW